MVGSGRGAQLGLLIKGPEILESTRRIDTIVLDKTGTVTAGEMALVDIAVADGDRDGALRLVGALEDASEHPIARAMGPSATTSPPSRWPPSACSTPSSPPPRWRSRASASSPTPCACGASKPERAALPPAPPTPTRPMRRRVRLLQRPEQPAAPRAHDLLLPLWGPGDLMVRRRRLRTTGAPDRMGLELLTSPSDETSMSIRD
jgi:haloacid dehalogenase-like hydrolase